MSIRSLDPVKFVKFALLVLATPAFAQDKAPFTVQETGKGFYRLDDAVKALGERDGTIIVAPGRYPDCAIYTGGNITIRAATPSTAIFDGGTCEGKATLVLKGVSATIEGLVFQNIKVPDANGAGIRLEHGDLTVRFATFRDSEQGIISADDPAGSIHIERSTFAGLGGCPNGMCSHSIYIGNYGSVTVERSRFERGTGGHYVKIRAARVAISNSSFDDSNGAYTNYMIDLPAGSTGTITGNTFLQGKNKENHSAFIAVAAEARTHPSAGLTVSGNIAKFAPGVTWPSTFVADWSHEPLKIGPNTLGPGIKVSDQR